MAILDDVKTALRISNTAYNTEITDLIDAAKLDLQYAGILSVDDTDKAQKQAIITYCKAMFGFQNSDADKLWKSYEMQRDKLSLHQQYVYYTITINCGTQSTVVFDGVEQETNGSGVVVFYHRAENQVKYTVNGAEYYLDVDGDETITL